MHILRHSALIPSLLSPLPLLPAGGWVGYTSYDTVRYVESKKLPFSSAPEDDRNLPDIHLGLYNDVVVFDHVTKVRCQSTLPAPRGLHGLGHTSESSVHAQMSRLCPFCESSSRTVTADSTVDMAHTSSRPLVYLPWCTCTCAGGVHSVLGAPGAVPLCQRRFLGRPLPPQCAGRQAAAQHCVSVIEAHAVLSSPVQYRGLIFPAIVPPSALLLPLLLCLCVPVSGPVSHPLALALCDPAALCSRRGP